MMAVLIDVAVAEVGDLTDVAVVNEALVTPSPESPAIIVVVVLVLSVENTDSVFSVGELVEAVMIVVGGGVLMVPAATEAEGFPPIVMVGPREGVTPGSFLPAAAAVWLL